MFDCVLFAFIISNLTIVVESQRHLRLKRQTQHKLGMLPTNLNFHKSIKVTNHDFVFATETVGFSQELLTI